MFVCLLVIFEKENGVFLTNYYKFLGLFVRFILPETKGKSLEEIERMFQERAEGRDEEVLEIEEVAEDGDD